MSANPPRPAPRLGLCVCYASAGLIERIGPDWDWIWIDGQHGEITDADLTGLVRACDLIQRPAFVRVPGHDYGSIGRALDAGAGAVIVPCVDSVAQAAAVVRAAKFPPTGGRSYGGRRVIDRQGRLYSARANAETLLVVQIESPEAVATADAIAALPGVDALFLGPDDLMLRRGLAMDTPRSPANLGDDLRAVAAAARRHGKLAATVGTTPEMAGLAAGLGYDYIAGAADVGLLAAGSAAAVAALRPRA